MRRLFFRCADCGTQMSHSYDRCDNCGSIGMGQASIELDNALRYQLGLYYTARLTDNQSLANKYKVLIGKMPLQHLELLAEQAFKEAESWMRQDWREICLVAGAPVPKPEK